MLLLVCAACSSCSKTHCWRSEAAALPGPALSDPQGRGGYSSWHLLKQLLDLQSEKTPILCYDRKIRLTRKADGRFFCLNFWHGIIWIFHLADMLHLQCLQFFLVSACNTSLLWYLSCNYRTSVCHRVTEKCFVWHAVGQISERLWKKMLIGTGD